jgi:heme-dependent oxidative N-demethylase alpha subunit-like protein
VSSTATTAAPERLLRRPLPFAAGGARHRVGARNEPLTAWLELDGAEVAGLLEEKQRLFDQRRDDVLDALPGSADACAEVVEAVRAAGVALPTGPAMHPLELVGRAVPEDVCVHLPGSDGRLILVAGCVCFPNKWLLADKIGKPVVAIHEPVPGYEPQIGVPVDRLMERMAPDRLMVRANWGITDGGELFAPTPWHLEAPEPSGLAERFWLRIERQTVRSLPLTGAVIFTIRTLHAPLAILRTDREAAVLLARALRELPHQLADYKLGGTAVRDAVLDWLDELAPSAG